jgi:hypothetical protein
MNRTVNSTILAADRGEFNSVLCRYEPEPAAVDAVLNECGTRGCM